MWFFPHDCQAYAKQTEHSSEAYRKTLAKIGFFIDHKKPKLKTYPHISSNGRSSKLWASTLWLIWIAKNSQGFNWEPWHNNHMRISLWEAIINHGCATLVDLGTQSTLLAHSHTLKVEKNKKIGAKSPILCAKLVLHFP